jgi:hypothetical protein
VMMSLAITDTGEAASLVTSMTVNPDPWMLAVSHVQRGSQFRAAATPLR